MAGPGSWPNLCWDSGLCPVHMFIPWGLPGGLVHMTLASICLEGKTGMSVLQDVRPRTGSWLVTVAAPYAVMSAPGAHWHAFSGRTKERHWARNHAAPALLFPGATARPRTSEFQFSPPYKGGESSTCPPYLFFARNTSCRQSRWETSRRVSNTVTPPKRVVSS